MIGIKERGADHTSGWEHIRRPLHLKPGTRSGRREERSQREMEEHLTLSITSTLNTLTVRVLPFSGTSGHLGERDGEWVVCSPHEIRHRDESQCRAEKERLEREGQSFTGHFLHRCL